MVVLVTKSGSSSLWYSESEICGENDKLLLGIFYMLEIWGYYLIWILLNLAIKTNSVCFGMHWVLAIMILQ